MIAYVHMHVVCLCGAISHSSMISANSNHTELIQLCQEVNILTNFCQSSIHEITSQYLLIVWESLQCEEI